MRPARTAGFTLVETLLAIAIAVLIAALAWSLLSTATRSVAAQEERAAGPAAASRALERVQADLAALFVPEGDDACAPALRAEDGARLSFCAVRAAGRAPDLVWSDPRRIEYALEAEGETGGALVRVEEALSGAIGRATNRLLSRVKQFEIALHDGAEWHRVWPPEGVSAPPPPRMARIVVRKDGMADPVSVECWIPVGHTFTSRLIRAASE